MTRVRVAHSFETDFSRQLLWLRDQGHKRWAERLYDEVAHVTWTLERLPELGREVKASDELVLRRLVLPKLPFIVFYSHPPKKPIRELWLVRLFHGRQRRL